MTLFARMIWGFTALLILSTISGAAGLLALHEIRKTSALTLQDTDLALTVRHMRAALFSYHDAGLVAFLTDDPGDKARLARSREMLQEHLSDRIPNSIPPEIRADYTDAKTKIGQILMFAPATRENGFLNPTYRKFFDSAVGDMDTVMAKSNDLVMLDRERNERFQRGAAIILFVASFLNLCVLVGVLFLFRRKVVLRLRLLNGLIDRIRGGDLSARWQRGNRDEIGKIGDTLNRLTRELTSLRKERVEFIGSVAHDLKNPLAAVSLNCDLVLRKGWQLTHENLLQHVGRIRNQVLRMRALTDDLMTAVKEGQMIWRLKMKKFSLESVVQHSIEAFEFSNPDHRYRLVIEETMPELQGDPDRIYQVVTNLISNAVKYSPARSDIEIVAGNEPVGGGVFFEVRDRGVGIPEETKGKLFQPFVRAKGAEKMAEGFGLGLSIVKNIVTAHGGEVSVTDRIGGGSIFRVSLPLVAAEQGWTVRRAS